MVTLQRVIEVLHVRRQVNPYTPSIIPAPQEQFQLFVDVRVGPSLLVLTFLDYFDLAEKLVGSLTATICRGIDQKLCQKCPVDQSHLFVVLDRQLVICKRGVEIWSSVEMHEWVK